VAEHFHALARPVLEVVAVELHGGAPRCGLVAVVLVGGKLLKALAGS